MVTGFTKFKEKFQGFEDQYVVIGGTACDLLMENETIDLKALGIRGFTRKSVINLLRNCYGIE